MPCGTDVSHKTDDVQDKETINCSELLAFPYQTATAYIPYNSAHIVRKPTYRQQPTYHKTAHISYKCPHTIQEHTYLTKALTPYKSPHTIQQPTYHTTAHTPYNSPHTTQHPDIYRYTILITKHTYVHKYLPLLVNGTQTVVYFILLVLEPFVGSTHELQLRYERPDVPKCIWYNVI